MINRSIRVSLLLLAAFCLFTLLPAEGRGQNGTLYFFTLKSGVLDPSTSGDTLFTVLENAHGTANEKREFNPIAIELEIYGISSGRTGLGLAVEVLRYEKTFSFPDSERVYLKNKGVLFTFKTFLRLGNLLPFIGAGVGNNYVNYEQSLSGTLSFRDSPSNTYNVQTGFRYLLGRYGMLFEVGRTSAKLDVNSNDGLGSLELGGTYSNFGLFWVY